MSQASNLPQIKKIELSVKQMRPPEGSKLVAALPDGTPIWEGPVFAGNGVFADVDPVTGVTDNGIVLKPKLGPDGKQRWRTNKTTGEKIVALHKASRRMKIVRFVMQDRGNGHSGPMPVPALSQAEATRQESDSQFQQFQRALFDAVTEAGIDMTQFVARLMEQTGVGISGPDAPVDVSAVPVYDPIQDAVEPEQLEDPEDEDEDLEDEKKKSGRRR